MELLAPNPADMASRIAAVTWSLPFRIGGGAFPEMCRASQNLASDSHLPCILGRCRLPHCKDFYSWYVRQYCLLATELPPNRAGRLGHRNLGHQLLHFSVRVHDGSDLQHDAVVKEDLRSHGRNLVPSIRIHLRRVATSRGSEKCAHREGRADGVERQRQLLCREP